RCRRRRQAGRVARLLDRADEDLGGDRVVEGDLGHLGRVVDRRGHAFELVELALDPVGARGAGHAADRQLQDVIGLGCSGVVVECAHRGLLSVVTADGCAAAGAAQPPWPPVSWAFAVGEGVVEVVVGWPPPWAGAVGPAVGPTARPTAKDSTNTTT